MVLGPSSHDSHHLAAYLANVFAEPCRLFANELGHLRAFSAAPKHVNIPDRRGDPVVALPRASIRTSSPIACQHVGRLLASLQHHYRVLQRVPFSPYTRGYAGSSLRTGCCFL